MTLYTDGSVINESAGAALYIPTIAIEEAIPLGTYSFISLAETRAIMESCQIIMDLGITNEIELICSESQAVLKALSLSLSSIQIYFNTGVLGETE